jgi:hypothetical protein
MAMLVAGLIIFDCTKAVETDHVCEAIYNLRTG